MPALRAQPGFLLYGTYESDDGALVTSFAVTEGREQALEANARILDWVGRTASELLPHRPEIDAGACAIGEVRPLPRRPNAPLHVTLRQHHGLGAEEQVMPLVRRHILPVLAGAPGFRAFFAFMDRERAGHGVGLTLFDSSEEAASANEQIVATMLEQGIAPFPPKVTTGPALGLAAAAWEEEADDPGR